jgi:hypothetical protein
MENNDLIKRCRATLEVAEDSGEPWAGHYIDDVSALLNALESMPEDAKRYVFLRALVDTAVATGVEVSLQANEQRLVYALAEEGKAIRLYWYPKNPVGFHEEYGDTLDEVLTKARVTIYGS